LGGEPLAEYSSLPFTGRAERHLHISLGNIDSAQPCSVGSIVRDIAGALAVTNDPEAVGPVLFHAV
jgi:hypothetical protein